MISNRKQSTHTLMIFSSTWLVLIIILAVSFFDFVEFPLWISLAVACLVGLTALFFYLGGYYFYQIEVKNNKELLIKYYNLFPAGRKFKAFQIPLKQFHHHTIRRRLGGLTSWLILYQKMQGGVAKYPPLGLSASSKEDRKAIQDFFQKLENRNA
jgi:hypothetical protein